MNVPTLSPDRSPCSVAERAAAQTIAEELARAGHRPVVDAARAPTSPTWAPLLRTLLRLWAAAFLAAGLPWPAAGLAAAALLATHPAVAGVLRFLPLVGGTTRCVYARVRGSARDLTSVVVVAHLDTHPTDGAPLSRGHRSLAAVSAGLVLLAGVAGRPVTSPVWRLVAGLVAAEAVVTLAWLARRELGRSEGPVDDNTSGLMALIRTAELASDTPAERDLWLVATGAATSGGRGMTSFLRSHPELRAAWVVEIDALGSGEVVASPLQARFPYPGTPASLVRSVQAAAQRTGDPVTVRRVRRPHSDARAAQRLRCAAITLTEGLGHPATSAGPDPANAARAARLAFELALEG